MIFWIGLLVLLLPTIVGAYFLFRDSMNLWQSVGPIYWVTRDAPTDHWVGWRVRRSWARSGGDPYNEGEGIEFRWSWRGNYRSTQIGIVTKRNVHVKWYDYDPKTLKEWQAPDKTTPTITQVKNHGEYPPNEG